VRNVIQPNANNPGANKQSVWLWVALVLAVGLSGWTAIQSEDPAEAVELTTSRQSMQAGATTKQVTHTQQPNSIAKDMSELIAQDGWRVMHRDASTTRHANLFATHSWEVIAPVAKATLAPPPEPTAPLTPFIYMGKMEDGPNGTQVFLMANNKVYAVAKGQVVDAMWRFDGEEAQQLLFTYLPLNLPQTLLKTTKVNPTYLPNNMANMQN
jgi:hypothetical protein